MSPRGACYHARMRLPASLLPALLILLPAHGQELQDAHLAFKRSRGEPPGPVRIRTVEQLARIAHPSNVDLFIKALEADTRDVAAEARKVERLEERYDRHARLLAGDPGGRKGERLREEMAQLKGDAGFYRERIRHLLAECDVLREGIRKALPALEADERTRTRDELARRLSSHDPYPTRRQFIMLAGEMPSPETLAALGELATEDRDPRVRADACEALGASGREEAEEPLVEALQDPYQVVRAAALRGLRRVGGRKAVEALIGRIPEEEGRLLEDVVVVLRYLTGVSFHDNIHLWREWWEKERPRYKRPRRRGKVVREGLKVRNESLRGNGPGFYGLRTGSHALVYLVDKSGSMNEPASARGVTSTGAREETKMDRAKRELIRSVRGLPKGVSINIIAYGDELEPYSRHMVELDDVQRRAIIAWVKSLRAKGKTNIYDAIEMVMEEARGRGQRLSKEMVIDTIFLLTDGMPTAGKVTDRKLLASEVHRLNSVPRIVIHTIGIGPDHDRSLLKELSADSQGLYIPAR